MFVFIFIVRCIFIQCACMYIGMYPLVDLSWTYSLFSLRSLSSLYVIGSEEQLSVYNQTTVLYVSICVCYFFYQTFINAFVDVFLFKKFHVPMLGTKYKDPGMSPVYLRKSFDTRGRELTCHKFLTTFGFWRWWKTATKHK